MTLRGRRELACDHEKWPLNRMEGTRGRGASLCRLRSIGEHTVNHGLAGACEESGA